MAVVGASAGSFNQSETRHGEECFLQADGLLTARLRRAPRSTLLSDPNQLLAAAGRLPSPLDPTLAGEIDPDFATKVPRGTGSTRPSSKARLP